MGIGIAIGKILLLALKLFFWVIIIQVALSWLIVFNVVNLSNPQARNFFDLLNKITDPVYRPLRRFIPAIGGIDITPIIVIFGIYLLESIVWSLFMTPTVMMR